MTVIAVPGQERSRTRWGNQFDTQARVLDAKSPGDGFLHGNGYVITWAIGHLAALAQPHETNPSWKQWRRDTLPMLPSWPLVVYEKTKHQFDVVKKILSSERISEIVCATDAGREGESA